MQRVSVPSVPLSWHAVGVLEPAVGAVHPSRGRPRALRGSVSPGAGHGPCGGEGIGTGTRSFHASFAGAERQKVGQKTMGDDRGLVQIGREEPAL